ncbi:MAG: DUF2490 domain-containing protein [Crocinitomicaceae bacterium]|nr:DUF2490 domain-containing protein [Crocinitomicaceae bacterium]
MGNLKSSILLLILFLSLTHLHAQNHTNSWMRATLSIPVKEHFSVDTEIQHRRQNGFNNDNLFDKNLVFSYRNWVHYQHQPGVKFSISPFAYYSNYKMIISQADADANPSSEIRFSGAMELKHQLGRKLDVSGRSALEYRIFDGNQNDILRFRNKLGLLYSINESWKLNAFMEILVNLSGTEMAHFLDHNRYGANVEYHPTKNIKMEFGYMYISRLPKINIQTIGENTLFLNVAYQFKKPEKQ